MLMNHFISNNICYYRFESLFKHLKLNQNHNCNNNKSKITVTRVKLIKHQLLTKLLYIITDNENV